jgi:hypothetical protein
MNLKDLYWLAGIVEGEGTLRLATSNYDYKYPRITVKMTDEDIVARVAKLMDASFTKIARSPSVQDHYKDQWKADIAGKRAAGWMMTLYPILGERRQAKVREILNAWRYS